MSQVTARHKAEADADAAQLAAAALPALDALLAEATAAIRMRVTADGKLFAEKPPNTTEWVTPMRAHACIAITASIDIGM